MSFVAVQGTVSNLKSCQADLRTGMDIVTDVALDLMEAKDGEVSSGIKTLEDMIMDCAKLDREMTTFIDVVEQVTSEVAAQEPEAMFRLSDKVKERFTRRMARLSDSELHQHQKVAAFKGSIKTSASQAKQNSASSMEEVDEDLAVTQSQVNFICPLTQVEMVNPVKNKKCNHHYEEAAILEMIQAKHRREKSFGCPVVGCGNRDVRQSDLIPDQNLKRAIKSHNKQSKPTK